MGKVLNFPYAKTNAVTSMVSDQDRESNLVQARDDMARVATSLHSILEKLRAREEPTAITLASLASNSFE